MSQVPQALETHMAREHDALAGDVVYFVRRPQYEFALTMAKTDSDGPERGQPVFRIRFRESSACQESILGFADLQDFYESLCQMMEYVYIEGGKSADDC